MDKEKKIYSLQVPLEEDLYTSFKINCLKNRQSIKDAIVELIEYYNEPLKLKEEDAKK